MTRFHDERAALHALNEEMGRALRAGPAPLASRRRGATDPLVVCGLIGGKDVGKSALVNALAGLEVSQDRDEIGEGTAGVIAYVHADDEPHLRARLQLMREQGAPPPLSPPLSSSSLAATLADAPVETIVRHNADALRGLALLDLPDVTSTFESHAAIVRAMAPLLDRVVWLWDPVLAGDRLYAERVGPVVKDLANVWLALNKVDLLARDEARPGVDPGDLWAQWRDWFASMARTASDEAGFQPEATDASRLFMVAAAFPTPDAFARAIERAWGDEGLKRHAEAIPAIARLGEAASRDLARLREALLTPISREDAARIKAANAAAETASDRARIERHFKLPELAALAEEAPAQIQSDFRQHFDPAFIETVAERLARRGMSTAELAERVLAIRVQAWPLLPAVYWLIRAPVRWVGRRVLAEGGGGAADDLMRIDGVPLRHRVDAFLARIAARQSGLLEAFRDPPEPPEPQRLAGRAEAEVQEAHNDVERGVVRDCLGRRGSPGPLRRAVVWLILAWFVLLQPLLEGLLTLMNADARGGAISLDLGDALHALAILVTTLGATALLKGLAVTLLVYVVMLMAMYGRAARDVRRVRAGSAGFSSALVPLDESMAGVAYAERVELALAEAVLRPALEPFGAIAARVEGWGQRSADPRRGRPDP